MLVEGEMCFFLFLNNLRIVSGGGGVFACGSRWRILTFAIFPPSISVSCVWCTAAVHCLLRTSVCPSRQRCGDLQCFHNEAELKNELLFQKKERTWPPPPQCGGPGVTTVDCSTISPWPVWSEDSAVLTTYYKTCFIGCAGAVWDIYLARVSVYPALVAPAKGQYGGINLAWHRVAHFINRSVDHTMKFRAINKKENPSANATISCRFTSSF